MTSTMLRTFRRCPACYQAIVRGICKERDTGAYRFGRAAHTYILEGEAAFKRKFIVDGPVNPSTGKSYQHESKHFYAWALERMLNPAGLVTQAEFDTIRRMRDSVMADHEAQALFARGWPERTARAELEGVDCQIRLDWLGDGDTAADLKTVENLDRLNRDIMRFNYLHQLAFYFAGANACGAGLESMCLVAVGKKTPHQIVVRRYGAGELEPAMRDNAETLRRYLSCKREGRWPATSRHARQCRHSMQHFMN
ncbi:MAG: PD-(D/E)XK nuclease-like domain-containing protein [Planctomycetes bacterium]|nr:PD-(D/E)XK nuclease-like domain-containing protein [Planctomycetota bacterium]